MRTTLLGSLLDAARRNLARGADDVRLFECGAVYLPRATPSRRGGPATRGTRRRPDAAARAHAPRRAADRPLRPPTWREPHRRGDFFAAKGVLEALLDALRVAVAGRAGAGEPFLHPGRAARACSPATTAPAGSASCTRSSPRDWDLEGGAPAFELDLDALVAQRAGGAALRGRHHVPGRAPGPRGRRRRRRPRRARARVVRARRRRAAALAPRSSTSTAASRSARAACRSRCGSSSAPPTGR